MVVQTGRRTIYVPKGSLSGLFRLLNSRGDENISSTLDTAIGRYLTVIQHSMPTFSDAEWCVIFDSLQSTYVSDETIVLAIDQEIAEGIEYEGLDEKWQIDGRDFVGRLAELTYAERQAIAEVVELFRMIKRHESYSDTIAKLIDQFSMDPSDLSELKAPRPPSMRPEDLHD